MRWAFQAARLGGAGPTRFHACRCLLVACGRGTNAAGRSCRPSCTVRWVCRCGRSQRSASLLWCTPAWAWMRCIAAAGGRAAHTLPQRAACAGRAALIRRISGSAAGSRRSQGLPGSTCAGRGRPAAMKGAALAGAQLGTHRGRMGALLAVTRTLLAQLAGCLADGAGPRGIWSSSIAVQMTALAVGQVRAGRGRGSSAPARRRSGATSMAACSCSWILQRASAARAAVQAAGYPTAALKAVAAAHASTTEAAPIAALAPVPAPVSWDPRTAGRRAPALSAAAAMGMPRMLLR